MATECTFEQDFLDAVVGAGKTDERLTSRQLFSAWFRVRGESHFFLFKKNLGVTSLPHAELLALLRVNSQGSTGSSCALQFISLADFFDHFHALLNDLQAHATDRKALANLILELYGNWLRRLVVVELFHGSCTVFVPPTIHVDLYSICMESGYIHSCGDNVYTRRLEELDPSDIVTTIRSHIERSGDPRRPRRYLTVYAHEDFTEHDRKFASELSGGLDESKVFVEKYFVGNTRFVSFLDKLRKDLSDTVLIPPPGPYHEQREAALSDPKLDPTRTMWFVVDRTVGRKTRHPGNQRYLVCYDQKYKNYNPFHYFDENKPAWVSHTTIPHTLAGAMINITRPWWPTDRRVVVADPFAGTGTVWLETHKFENVDVRCSDLARIAPLLAEDNRIFFALASAELDALKAFLAPIAEGKAGLRAPSSRRSPDSEDPSEAYDQAIKVFNSVDAGGNDEDLTFTVANVEQLKSMSFRQRLLFYVCLRTHVRHAAGLERRSEAWLNAYQGEVVTLCSQIDDLSRLRKRQDTPIVGEERGFLGRYSLGAGMPRSAMSNERNGGRVAVKDACDWNEDGIDVIVTDPPYGFNTNDNAASLARVYAKAMAAMIRSLNDGGQIVMAVPERSYTGRNVASFTTRGWITQQMVSEAHAGGYEIVTSANVFPRPGGLFFPPYYWESAKALGRAILHFRFRRLH